MVKRKLLDHMESEPSKMAKRETSMSEITAACQTIDQPQQLTSDGEREVAPVQTSKKKKSDTGEKAKKNVQHWAPEEDEIILREYLSFRPDWQNLADKIRADVGKERTKISVERHWDQTLKGKVLSVARK